MEHLIDDLVTRFERGRLTRRELVQTLAAVAVAGAGAPASAAALTAGSINHTSVLVSDMARSVDFYNRVFGLTVLNEDKPNKISRLGTGGRFSLRLTSRVACPRSFRQAESEASPWLNPIWV